MGTARQVDLLRTEVGSGFTELRTTGETLRTELLTAVTDGLRDHRDALINELTRERQETELAHRDNRKLQRQLTETRDELHRLQLQAVEASTSTAQTGTEAVTDPVRPAADADPPAEVLPTVPQVGTPEPTGAETPEPEPTHLFVKETVVPETAPAEESSSPEAGITAEQAHQLIELLGRLAPAPVTVTVPEQQAVEQAVPVASVDAGGVADLIPAVLAWPAHVATLLKAAAVNTVAVSCNPHTWEFLQQRVEGAEHFDQQKTVPQPRGAGQDDQGDNILSGRSVIALLNALRGTVYAGTGQEVESWALAVTCYERIAEVVNATRPAGDDQQFVQPRIVLDDLSVKTVGGEHR
ncbi:hypothetical protein P3T27_006592 [Kitasatospora sp. MAA19]|uniref:hypothetical protein n=1 Tax=Kitasatospora sp. MAA19 TaxID=3035090 RepID=UPI00247474A4|nr:hypothetical protein [Kitasatospora sp. MAA19]MDH6709843.1 hypothetical protein [Kitasatospora sp. MAA19]